MMRKLFCVSPKWYLFVRCLLTFAAGFAAGLSAGAAAGENAAAAVQTAAAAGAALMLAFGYIGGLLRILKSDI